MIINPRLPNTYFKPTKKEKLKELKEEALKLKKVEPITTYHEKITKDDFNNHKLDRKI
ncbi:MAG: hypothetical protein RSE91_02760 [Bacilli bacterium]